VALAWLARPGNGLDLAEQARIAGQVLAVMDEPALAPCSAPAAGRSSRGGVGRGQVIVGQVDRMVVCPDAVLLCDFKTNRLPPADV
jgi:ATP-dependent helicase/nuclease subunit A